MANMLKAIGAEDKVLLVTNEKDELIRRAGNNLPKLEGAYPNTINVYDILRADKLVITKDAVKSIEEVYA
jgi:large subunit ribosomal protein L4